MELKKSDLQAQCFFEDDDGKQLSAVVSRRTAFRAACRYAAASLDVREAARAHAPQPQEGSDSPRRPQLPKAGSPIPCALSSGNFTPPYPKWFSHKKSLEEGEAPERESRVDHPAVAPTLPAYDGLSAAEVHRRRYGTKWRR